MLELIDFINHEIPEEVAYTSLCECCKRGLDFSKNSVLPLIFPLLHDIDGIYVDDFFQLKHCISANLREIFIGKGIDSFLVLHHQSTLEALHINDLDGCLFQLLHTLPYLNNLRVLSLNNCKIDDESLELLIKTLKSTKRSVPLELFLDDNEFTLLPACIRELELDTLSISNCKVSEMPTTLNSSKLFIDGTNIELTEIQQTYVNTEIIGITVDVTDKDHFNELDNIICTAFPNAKHLYIMGSNGNSNQYLQKNSNHFMKNGCLLHIFQ
ncbi:hypothetical protein PCE1_001036 [Barthelona sp. PCE]